MLCENLHIGTVLTVIYTSLSKWTGPKYCSNKCVWILLLLQMGLSWSLMCQLHCYKINKNNVTHYFMGSSEQAFFLGYLIFLLLFPFLTILQLTQLWWNLSQSMKMSFNGSCFIIFRKTKAAVVIAAIWTISGMIGIPDAVNLR